jgi:molybdopterin synthase catalytic subunit
LQIRVLYFAVARERAGVSNEALDLPTKTTVGAMRERICKKHPTMSLLAVDAVRIAVNQEFVGDDFVLHDGDEVALIPPVSGGA